MAKNNSSDEFEWHGSGDPNPYFVTILSIVLVGMLVLAWLFVNRY